MKIQIFEKYLCILNKHITHYFIKNYKQFSYIYKFLFTKFINVAKVFKFYNKIIIKSPKKITEIRSLIMFKNIYLLNFFYFLINCLPSFSLHVLYSLIHII